MNARDLIEKLQRLPEKTKIIYMDQEQPKSPMQILTGILVEGEDRTDFLSDEYVKACDPEDFGLDKWPDNKVALLD